MVFALESNEERLRRDGQIAESLRKLSVQLSNASSVKGLFEQALSLIRQSLGCDRMLVYRFDETWKGVIIAESVAAGWPRALGAEIDDPCFANNYVEKYRQG
ncbi:MAG: chemotaxis protein, partial [Chloroflexaceae bacterium]|nr:chemotaxis protein [Chloroflexaceae bacterium]